MRRRVTARLVTVQASNTEAVWMITSALKHFQPRTHTFSQCTCWGTATLHSLADCSEAAARSLCEGEAFQMQIYTSIGHSMRTSDRELSYSLPGHDGLDNSSLLILERINVRTLFLKFFANDVNLCTMKRLWTIETQRPCSEWNTGLLTTVHYILNTTYYYLPISVYIL